MYCSVIECFLAGWDQNAWQHLGVSKGIFPTLQIGIGAKLISVTPPKLTLTRLDRSASVRGIAQKYKQGESMRKIYQVCIVMLSFCRMTYGEGYFDPVLTMIDENDAI